MLEFNQDYGSFLINTNSNLFCALAQHDVSLESVCTVCVRLLSNSH